VPSRDLSPTEVVEQLRWFTLGQRGPRGTPCDGVVLSGVPDARMAEVGDAVTASRQSGVQRVVLHTRHDLEAPAWADEVVAILSDASTPIVGGAGRVLVLVLERTGASDHERLTRLLDRALAARPARIVFSWPFPPRGAPLPAAEVVVWLDAVAADLDASGVAWAIKGLPACLIGRFGGRQSRTRNRWYVDADHQGSAARLFHPDVVRYAKADACRFCVHDAVCDGVAQAWFDLGLSGALRPVERASSRFA
jgi:hypothetical protein